MKSVKIYYDVACGRGIYAYASWYKFTTLCITFSGRERERRFDGNDPKLEFVLMAMYIIPSQKNSHPQQNRSINYHYQTRTEHLNQTKSISYSNQ